MNQHSSKDFEQTPNSAESAEESKEETTSHQQIPKELKPHLEVIELLKNLCIEVSKLTKLAQFFSSKAKLFKILPKDGEQSLKQFQGYISFIEILEPHIETFLESKGLEEEKAYQSIQKVANFNQKYLQDIELLIAATDYQAFSKLMNEIYRNSKKGKKQIQEMELV